MTNRRLLNLPAMILLSQVFNNKAHWAATSMRRFCRLCTLPLALNPSFSTFKVAFQRLNTALDAVTAHSLTSLCRCAHNPYPLRSVLTRPRYYKNRKRLHPRLYTRFIRCFRPAHGLCEDISDGAPHRELRGHGVKLRRHEHGVPHEVFGLKSYKTRQQHPVHMQHCRVPPRHEFCRRPPSSSLHLYVLFNDPRGGRGAAHFAPPSPSCNRPRPLRRPLRFFTRPSRRLSRPSLELHFGVSEDTVTGRFVPSLYVNLRRGCGYDSSYKLSPQPQQPPSSDDCCCFAN